MLTRGNGGEKGIPLSATGQTKGKIFHVAATKDPAAPGPQGSPNRKMRVRGVGLFPDLTGGNKKGFHIHKYLMS